MERAAFVTPTLDEAPSIGVVIQRIPVPDLGENVYETDAYVVDERSVDQTKDIAVPKGGQVITEPGSGKGAVIQTGFRP